MQEDILKARDIMCKRGLFPVANIIPSRKHIFEEILTYHDITKINSDLLPVFKHLVDIIEGLLNKDNHRENNKYGYKNYPI